MIIKGGSRKSGRFFASHLMKTDENERVAIIEMRGLYADDLPEAFREMRLLASGTRCSNNFYHASINPHENEYLSSEQWEMAVDTLERNLGFAGHVRFVVEHEKEGRVHRHVVWSRIDPDTMTAKSDSNNYLAHDKTRLELEQAFNHELTAPTREHGNRKSRHIQDWEHFRAQDSKIDPREVKLEITQLWQRSDSGHAFSAALEEHGFVLCKGDRRDFCVIDQVGDSHSLARRIEGVRAVEVRTRLSDIDRDSLLTVAEASARIRAKNQESSDYEKTSSNSDPLSQYFAARTCNDDAAPRTIEKYRQSLIATMRRNGGELHHGDGLTWWERAYHHFEMAYDKTLEIVIRMPKEVVDTTKNLWQEFVERFSHGNERSHNFDQPDQEWER